MIVPGWLGRSYYIYRGRISLPIEGRRYLSDGSLSFVTLSMHARWTGACLTYL